MIKSKINYYNIIRKNIRKFRLEKGYSYKELAAKANMSIDFLKEIESEIKNKNFSLDTLGKIAEALDIDIRNFFD